MHHALQLVIAALLPLIALFGLLLWYLNTAYGDRRRIRLQVNYFYLMSKYVGFWVIFAMACLITVIYFGHGNIMYGLIECCSCGIVAVPLFWTGFLYFDR